MISKSDLKTIAKDLTPSFFSRDMETRQCGVDIFRFLWRLNYFSLRVVCIRNYDEPFTTLGSRVIQSYLAYAKFTLVYKCGLKRVK